MYASRLELTQLDQQKEAAVTKMTILYDLPARTIRANFGLMMDVIRALNKGDVY